MNCNKAQVCGYWKASVCLDCSWLCQSTFLYWFLGHWQCRYLGNSHVISTAFMRYIMNTMYFTGCSLWSLLVSPQVSCFKVYLVSNGQAIVIPLLLFLSVPLLSLHAVSTAFHAIRHESNLFLCITDLEYPFIHAQWTCLNDHLVANVQGMVLVLDGCSQCMRFQQLLMQFVMGYFIYMLSWPRLLLCWCGRMKAESMLLWSWKDKK